MLILRAISLLMSGVNKSKVYFHQVFLTTVSVYTTNQRYIIPVPKFKQKMALFPRLRTTSRTHLFRIGLSPYQTKPVWVSHTSMGAFAIGDMFNSWQVGPQIFESGELGLE